MTDHIHHLGLGASPVTDREDEGAVNCTKQNRISATALNSAHENHVYLFVSFSILLQCLSVLFCLCANLSLVRYLVDLDSDLTCINLWVLYQICPCGPPFLLDTSTKFLQNVATTESNQSVLCSFVAACRVFSLNLPRKPMYEIRLISFRFHLHIPFTQQEAHVSLPMPYPRVAAPFSHLNMNRPPTKPRSMSCMYTVSTS